MMMCVLGLRILSMYVSYASDSALEDPLHVGRVGVDERTHGADFLDMKTKREARVCILTSDLHGR
jgi:hypothetical protein